MLNPIRQELDLGPDIYESLDEDMIDVTQERIEEARIKSTPFDHGRLSAYFERFKDSQKNRTEALETSAANSQFFAEKQSDTDQASFSVSQPTDSLIVKANHCLPSEAKSAIHDSKFPKKLS